MGKVLIDTSVWIDFFRGRTEIKDRVVMLLDERRVCCNGLILAELMQGAKSEREIAVVSEFLHVLDFLPETPKLWEKAGRLSFTLRRQGVTVGLADCFIAISAMEAGAELLTADAHFDKIRSTTNLILFEH